MPVKNKTYFGTLLLVMLLLAGCSSPEEKEARYIKRGNELFDKGEFEKARVEYKNAFRIKPTDTEVLYRIGMVDEAEGNIRAAFTDFGHSEEQNPHYHPTLLKLAEYYIANNQYDQAKKRLAIVLGETPNDPEAHALVAASSLRQKDFDNTEKEARTALGFDPVNITAYSVLAGMYSAQNNDTKAESTVDEGIAKNPQALSLLLLKANIAEHGNNIEKVDQAFQQIFKLKPEERRFRIDLANVYLKAGQLDKAEATLRAGVVALPKDWEMKHALVEFLGEKRGLDSGEKEVRGYMESFPKQDELYSWLVDLYVRHNAIDRAIAFLNQIIDKNQFDKQGLSARTSMARIDYIQGKKEDADKLTKIVLEKDPNNLDALFMKANLEFDHASYQQAITDLNIILGERPQSKDALRLLSETYAAQGHLDLAIDKMNHLMELDPMNNQVRVRLAQMDYLNGDIGRAQDLLFIVTKTAPQYPLGWESTARISIDLKDWTTANKAVDTLDKLDGQNLTASYLRGEILAKSGKPDEAVVEFKKVAEADPAAPVAEMALKSMALTNKELKHQEDTIVFIESLKVRTPAINTLLGECYLDEGKQDLAASAFDAAISANTPHQDAYLYRAKLDIDAKKDDDAINLLKKAVAAIPEDARASLLEAQILGKLGRYKETIAVYEEIVARDPSQNIAANNLAEMIANYEYADSAQLEKARQVAERFEASSNPVLLDTLAWIYYRQGNMQQAQVVMQRVVSSKATLPPEVHYHYGAILAKAGNTSAAKLELQQAVADGVEPYLGLDDAKKLLQNLK